MRLEIVTLGKLKDNKLKVLEQDFLLRLQRFARIKITELKDELIPTGASKTQEQQIKTKDTQKALEYVKSQEAKVFFLDEQATELSSVQFAAELKKHEAKKIIFVIGPVLGFDKVLIQKESKIALSKMTWTHRWARVMLIEQIYRACCINNNISYHKQ